MLFLSLPSAQGNWADLSGSNASQLAIFAGTADRSKIDAIGLFTGQVGYSWGAFLLYAKGGAAVAHDKYDSFLTAPLGPLPIGFIADRGGETRWGGVIGVGGEYSLTRNWSFALEYDHLFMGNGDVAIAYDPASSPRSITASASVRMSTWSPRAPTTASGPRSSRGIEFQGSSAARRGRLARETKHRGRDRNRTLVGFLHYPARGSQCPT